MKVNIAWFGDWALTDAGETTLRARRHKNGWRCLVKHNGRRVYRGNNLERAKELFHASQAGKGLSGYHVSHDPAWPKAVGESRKLSPAPGAARRLSA